MQQGWTSFKFSFYLYLSSEPWVWESFFVYWRLTNHCWLLQLIRANLTQQVGDWKFASIRQFDQGNLFSPLNNSFDENARYHIKRFQTQGSALNGDSKHESEKVLAKVGRNHWSHATRNWFLWKRALPTELKAPGNTQELNNHLILACSPGLLF